MSSIFDGYASPATPGTVTPGTMPKRPDEYSFFRDWYLPQIFDPDIHQPTDVWVKYVVPYEGELVKDTKNKKLYIVSHVDTTTWKSTLLPFDFENTKGEDTGYPLYPESEYGMLQGEFPLFIDYSVLPPTCRVSSMAYQTNPAYAKLFYGNIIDESAGAQVISAIYANNDLVSDRIPVVTVMPPGFNVEQDVIKCADTFSVNLPKETLKNGTRCTLVYFDENGFPLAPTYSLMVQHSEYLRNHQLSKRFVKSIDLLSPWFTNSGTPKTLYLPVNLALTSVVFRARINYSDGTSEVQPVNSFDGDSGFTLHGTDGFKPTTPNQKDGLTLTYKFQPGEEAEVAQPGQPDHMSVNYDMIAVAVDGAYTPRLYVYPYWTAYGYQLRFFLGDLTRKFMIDVTQWVRLNRTSPAFSGTSYGVEQKLTYNLTLSDVSPSFSNWTFTQTVIVTLFNEGTSALRKWDVINSPKVPAFQNLEILYTPQVNGGQVAKFGGGYTSVTAFLNAGYYAIDPSINTMREDKPIVPTHMKLIRQVSGESITLPVGSYNNLQLGSFTMNNAETYYISWIQRDASGNELQLGLSAAITRKTTSSDPEAPFVYALALDTAGATDSYVFVDFYLKKNGADFQAGGGLSELAFYLNDKKYENINSSWNNNNGKTYIRIILPTDEIGSQKGKAFKWRVTGKCTVNNTDNTKSTITIDRNGTVSA